MGTFGSMFAGAGGLDLALEQFGYEPAWQAEIDKHASAVLAQHWPTVPNLGDVTAIDWGWQHEVDVIAAGFPCQPISTAGKRLGRADERWLWPEVARAVRHVRPRHVVLENVPAILARGAGDVLSDLACLGYDVRWGCVRASAAGAPHRRERWFCVATDTESGRWEEKELGIVGSSRGGTSEPRERFGASVPCSASVTGDGFGWGKFGVGVQRWEQVLGRTAPAPASEDESGRLRILPDFLEWMLGFNEGWTAVAVDEGERLKMMGNAVCPQQGVLALSSLGLPVA